MKKKILAGILALGMAFSMVACGSGATTDGAGPSDASADVAESGSDAESDIAYIQGKGTLIVGITDFAPMDYKDDNGEWIGFDADMARKVAESMGVDIEFVEIDWDNKVLELDYHLFRVKRLDYEVLDPVLHGVYGIGYLTVGAHHDYGHAEALIAHPADELVAIHARHLQVHEDSVKRLLSEDPLRRIGILRPDTVNALDLHVSAHQVPDVGLIVNYQNSHTHTSSADTRQADLSHRSSAVTVIKLQGPSLGLDKLL